MARQLLPALAVTVSVVLGGCGPDLGDVPMPRLVSGPTYTLDAVFESALNLPEQAPVKLNGETVGEIVSVRAVDYRAHVRMRISRRIRIPADSRAEVRLTAPIGESFVALLPPKEARRAEWLSEGSTIDLAHTRAAPDTTDLLTSLSVAVTGGSYADLKTVVTELTAALDGNADEVKHLLGRLDVLVTDLNTHRDDLDAALDGLDRLSGLLAKDSDSLVTSTEQLTPAIEELSRHHDRAMELLESMTRLSTASTDVINSTRRDLGHQLRDATTLLDTVVDAQDKLAPTLTGISEFATKLDAATPGDYTIFELTIMSNPRITGLPFVNLDGSNPLHPPEFGTPTPPPLPDAEKLTETLPELLGGLLGGTS